MLVVEESDVNAAAVTQDNMTEEAIGSPLAMWELEIQNIELEKGEGGLGFSILDYQVGTLPGTGTVIDIVIHQGISTLIDVFVLLVSYTNGTVS